MDLRASANPDLWICVFALFAWQRAAKANAGALSRRVARQEREDYAGAVYGPEDCKATRWLHLKVTKAMTTKAKAMDPDTEGLIRAMSPPFFHEGELSQEVKWVLLEDHVATVRSFEGMVELFGMDPPFLEWVSHWHYHMTPAYPREMKAMIAHFKFLPVRSSPFHCDHLPKLRAPLRPQHFELGQTVALKDKHWRRIPKGLFGHLWFKITTMPAAKYYVRREPAWAQLAPCDRAGRLVPGHEPFPVGLTWLDKRLRIDHMATDKCREHKLLSFLLAKAETSNCTARLKV